jgi:type III pantothenate kinase
MNIVVDYGNTTAKVGIFRDEALLEKHLFPGAASLRSFLEGFVMEHLMVSSVSHPAEEVMSWATPTGKKYSLTHRLPLPVKILYATPQTLGVDRIAAVCGAIGIFPSQHCLVIDAGTCVNYEYIDHLKNYHGGAISPGIMMRFDAMHQFTSRLPLVEPALLPPLIGDTTEACMQSGVVNGIRTEIEGIIQHYINLYSGIKVILCGGDVSFFENHIKPSIFVAPDLVLHGLNAILRFNAGNQ